MPPVPVDIAPGPKYTLPKLVGQDGHDPQSNFQKGPAFTLKGRRKKRKPEVFPGPGAYSVDSSVFIQGKDEGPKVTIKGRYSSPKLKKAAPDPGKYYNDATWNNEYKSAPAFTLSSRPRKKTPEQTPGPAAYLPDIKTNQKAAPAFTLSSKLTSGKRKREAFPGPGQYDNPNGTDRYGRHEGKQCTLKGRYKDEKTDKNPGPGAYFPSITPAGSVQSAPAYSFGSRTKLKDKELVPGPGSYDLSALGQNANPGAHPAFSFGGKRRIKSFDSSPGPASYNPGKVFNNGRDEGVGVTFKGRRKTKIRMDPVGPGKYSPRDVEFSSGPSYSLAGRHKPKKKDETPGPGQYVPDPSSTTSIKQKPSYSFGSRTKLPKKDQAPAPNMYNVDTGLTNRGSTTGVAYSLVGRTNRSGKRKAKQPGPASYNPDPDKTTSHVNEPAFSFGTKSNKTKYDITPGPAAYDSSSTLGGGPAVGIHGKLKSRKPDKTPGPLDYDPKGPPGDTIGSNAKITIKGRAKTGKMEKVPGPGYYATDKIDNSVILPRQPAYTLGVSFKKDKDKKKDELTTPGPAQYDVGSTPSQSGPSYSLAPKLKGRERTNLPGPGQYDPVEPEKYKRRSVDYRFQYT